MKIPLTRPLFPKYRSISKYLDRCRKSGIFTNFGPLFEEATEKLTKISERQCLPCNNGTSAIELACRVQFKKGDRILVPDFTHAGTIQAVRAAGCIPVLGKIDSKTWTLDESEIDDSFDGAVIVSPFGYYVDVEGYDKTASHYGIPLVYDFAGAWGFFPKTIHPVCYSLHATKNFSCGEGGVVSFSSWSQWQDAQWYSNFCTDKDRTVRSLDGGNLKASEILCAIILAHVDNYKNLEDRIFSKLKYFIGYKAELGLYSPPAASPSLLVFEGISPKVAVQLNSEGITVIQYYARFAKNICESISTSEEIVRYALPSDITKKEFAFIKEAFKRPNT